MLKLCRRGSHYCWNSNHSQNPPESKNDGHAEPLKKAGSQLVANPLLMERSGEMRGCGWKSHEQSRMCAQVLYSNKDSRVVWVKGDHILTTGFSQSRQQEVRLWDYRKLNSSLSSASLATSSG
ncbi:coronin-7 isoform X1 [Tachysurus ichikawai]